MSDLEIIQGNQEWLEGNHRVISEGNGVDQEYHVFAMVDSPPFSRAQNKKYIQIDIPIGPAILQIRGEIDLTTLDIDISVYLKLPLLPPILIARFKGNLKDGVEIRIDTPQVRGIIRLFVRDGWLWISFDLTILGRTYKAEFKLIPI